MHTGACAQIAAAALAALLGGTTLSWVKAAAAQDAWQTEVTSEHVRSEAPADTSIVPGVPLETGAVQPRVPQATAVVIANAASLTGGPERTSFTLSLSKGVTAEVFTLANPYRVVVDLPDVAFDLAPEVGRTGTGLVRAFRYGLFAEGKARIVLDASGPVKIEKAVMSALPGSSRVALQIDLAPTAAESFGDGTGAKRQTPPSLKPQVSDDAVPQQRKGHKPVIVIDPGHGGIDAGAVGVSNLLEKSLVLAAGLELRRALVSTGRYDVRMTRSSDVFIPLDSRLKLCRTLGADLFISLHADSLEQKLLAQTVRGATIYTLSERASDEQARLMAEKENATDLLAGIDAGESHAGDQVKGILIDLMKRETSNFSTEFSNLLVARLRKSVPLSRDPQRFAAFKVLKQTYAPAVLVELGYMSNNDDEKLLNSPDGQRQVAQSVAAAVDTYFSRQTARAGERR